MRRILIDIARAKTYQKRGGRALHVTFSEDLPIVASDAETVLAVHHALDALSATHPRKARVVEMRFFGGMSLDEVGAVLEMSVETAKRDWKFARAWLRRELEHGRRGL
jgi:RNA polymerase sigma factor (TIGR02999 family)